MKPKLPVLILAALCCLFVTRTNSLKPVTEKDVESYASLLQNAYSDNKKQGKLYEMESVEILTQPYNEAENFSAFNVTLKYFKTELPLQMKKNKVTLRNGVKLVWFNENGTRISANDESNGCEFYQGRVVDDLNSVAAMSICNDHLEGAVVAKNQRYVIKAKSGSAHSRRRRSKHGITLGTHWVTIGSQTHSADNRYGYIDLQMNSTERSRRDIPLLLSETKYVELYIVNDKSEFIWLGSNLQNNMKRMKQIANIIDSFYQPHNIRIVLKGVEVWTDSDKITIKANIQETLMAFLSYRANTIMSKFYNDNAILVSHIDFTGPTIGLAPMSAMCNLQNSGNVNQDTNWDYSHVAATITHELGHNFGMDHDGASCVCHGSRGVCLMSPYAQNPIPMVFSECSKQNLITYLNKGLGGCLLNKPDTGIYYDDKQCGNNKLDPGEDCDCGYPAYCQNPCCDANTCKYTAGSQCSTGKCCENCRLKTAGTICRSISDPCDINEACDGINGQCPENLYKQDGKSCNEHGQDGHCFGGFCRTYNGQCKRVWGTAAIAGDSSCYSVMNPTGDQYGNCGVSGSFYVRCSRADAGCGKLFCDNVPTNGFPVIGFGKSRYTVSFYINGRMVYCYSGEANLGQTQPDPLLTSNGVICGNGMACRNQRCVSASQLLTNPCPGDCHGNGLCTQKGTCVCNQGWLPPNCEIKATTTTTQTTVKVDPTSQTHTSDVIINPSPIVTYNNTETNIRGNATAAAHQPEKCALVLTFVIFLVYYP